MTYSRSLVTFAFVRDALQKGDIVTGLFPLFAPAIKRHRGKPFDPQVFTKDLNELCGLSVHPFIVEDWAPRMAQQGLLVARESEAAGGRIFTNYTYADPDIPDVQGLETRIVELFDTFEAYAAELYKQHGLPVPKRDVLERELVERIQSMGFEDILSKPDRNGSSPGLSGTLTLDKKSAESSPQQHAAQIMDVVCATFFLELSDKQKDKFDLVTDLAAGALGAEVVLTFRVPPKSGSSFKGMRVYLDSPLILDLLNVGGDQEREFASYLLDALKQEGATVATFDHNVDEIVDVLTAANNNYERKQEVLGQIGARLRGDRNTILRVKNVLANPIKRVRDVGIDITVAKAIDRQYLQYFDDNAEKDLLSAIRPFQPIEARAVDAASIASQIRYLYGRRPKGGLMTHERLFVTKNTGLVRAAVHYIGRLEGLDVTDAPILSDRAMAGILWVASGGKGLELPLHKLLASCTAAVRPRRDVINKVREVLQEASPEDLKTFETMIEDDRCSFSLMQNSLGDVTLVTGESTPRLLGEMKRAMAAEVEQKKDEELERQRLDYEDKVQAEIALRRAEIEAAESRLSKATNDLKDALQTVSLISEQNETLAHNLAAMGSALKLEREGRVNAAFHRSRYAEWFTYAVVFLPIAVVLYFVADLSGSLSSPWNGIAGLSISFALGLIQFAKFPNILFGSVARRVRLKSFHRQLEKLNLTQYKDAPIDWVNGVLNFTQADIAQKSKVQERLGTDKSS